MGHAYAKIRIRNSSDESKFMDLELIADTSSTYTWIKRRKLENLGIRPMTKSNS